MGVPICASAQRMFTIDGIHPAVESMLGNQRTHVLRWFSALSIGEANRRITFAVVADLSGTTNPAIFLSLARVQDARCSLQNFREAYEAILRPVLFVLDLKGASVYVLQLSQHLAKCLNRT